MLHQALRSPATGPSRDILAADNAPGVNLAHLEEFAHLFLAHCLREMGAGASDEEDQRSMRSMRGSVTRPAQQLRGGVGTHIELVPENTLALHGINHLLVNLCGARRGSLGHQRCLPCARRAGPCRGRHPRGRFGGIASQHWHQMPCPATEGEARTLNLL